MYLFRKRDEECLRTADIAEDDFLLEPEDDGEVAL